MNKKTVGIPAAIATLIMSACGPANQNTQAVAAKPTRLSAADLTALVALGNDALYRKAKIGELGNCTLTFWVVKNQFGNDDSYTAILLTDRNVYFPGMVANKNHTNWHSYDTEDVGKYLFKALNEGYCFSLFGN